MPLLRELLRRQREQRGLSQEELAALVEPPLSPDTVSNLERGRTRPHRHTLEALCQALGLDDSARQEVWAAWRARAAAGNSAATSVGMAGAGVAAGQPTRLIGREQELRALQQRLLQPEVRLLTLAGPGGVGKTRLALRLMELVAERFKDGARFVDLSALRDAGLVLPTIASALGIHDTSSQSALRLLVQALSTRPALLVLDNFEQLLEAAGGLAELLSACPEVKLLVTSREPLGSRWEHLYVVPSLAVPDRRDQASLEAVRSAPAVALFLERARAVDERFALTVANAATIATLCGRLDGLPLALELAAARVRTLSPSMLLDHLDRQLDLLTGSRDAPARQRSLRATLTWSYALLNDHEQVLLRRLGVFAGGCRLEAAEVVCSGIRIQAMSGLLTLVEKNLLRQEDRADGTRRYRLLETVRTYAVEQLRAHNEQTAAAASHAQYYLELAEEAAPHLDGPVLVAWLDRLEEEHDNLRAALRWLADAGDAEAGLRMACALHGFWLSRGHVPEGRAWFDAFLGLSAARASPGTCARALNAAGLLASNEHEYLVARDLHHRALSIAQGMDDGSTIATALSRLGDVADHLGDAPTAFSHFHQAVSVCRANRLQKELAATLQELGDAEVNRGDYPAAQRALEESLELFRHLSDRQGIARVSFSLGQVGFGRGEERLAVAWFEQSLGLYTEINRVGWVAGAAMYLGLALVRCGDLARARSLLEHSIRDRGGEPGRPRRRPGA
ncbi:MAG: helix-turn-helix domain-containing protein [Chloroflexi bacterium]|nr:helix-turn-helix domain-containing protein [Chloroflexota bacterium]